MISKTNSDAGVSVVLSYALLLSVTAFLISVLLIGINSFATDKKEQAAKTELQVSVEMLAAELEESDRSLQQVDDLSTAQLERTPTSDSPIRNSNAKYSVQTTVQTDVYILVGEKPDTTVTTRFKLETAGFNTSTVGNSKTLKIVYDNSTQRFRFTSVE